MPRTVRFNRAARAVVGGAIYAAAAAALLAKLA